MKKIKAATKKPKPLVVTSDVSLLDPDGEEVGVIPAKIMQEYMRDKGYTDTKEETVVAAAERLLREAFENFKKEGKAEGRKKPTTKKKVKKNGKNTRKR